MLLGVLILFYTQIFKVITNVNQWVAVYDMLQ